MAKKQLGTFTGTGSSVSWINDRIYGYSGIIGVTDTEADLIKFQSGKGYIKAKVQFNYPTSDGDNFIYRIYFNNQVVQAYVIDHSALYGYQNSVIHLIIPPLTEVKLTADNQGSSSARSQCVSITGRIYNA